MIPFDSTVIPDIISGITPYSKNAYLVGGSVRDILLGKSPADFDIAVLQNPQQYAEKMTQKTSGRLVRLGKPGQMIFRVITKNYIFDISSVNGSVIEDDLWARDFTINALAVDLGSGKMIDCMNGLQDLADRKIRLVSPAVFQQDPIRLIRAYRMAAAFDFNVEPQTSAKIKDNAALLQTSAGERIRAELFKILATSNSCFYFSEMATTGVLFTIFPELAGLQNCFQNRYHHFDVFTHTMKAYSHLEIILNDCHRFLPEAYGQFEPCKDILKGALLKCAILLHDIGKPSARTIDNNGHIHFYGHGKKSADLAMHIARRLKFSNHETSYIDFIIRHHIRPLFLFTAYTNKTVTQKGIARFFLTCGKNAPDLLIHTMADIKGKGNQNDERNQAFINFAREMLTYYFSYFQPEKSKAPLLTGNDLIHDLALTPSPLFKTILRRVEEARITKKICTKDEAMQFVKKFLAV
ncbi:MAG: HD domain-containing protein [Thermodesulfobacteriota bacterium]|nr:HD domain-containing protein [Thermodesulfobacteriota bacterium]